MRLEQVLLTIYNQKLLKDNSITQEEFDKIQAEINRKNAFAISGNKDYNFPTAIS